MTGNQLRELALRASKITGRRYRLWWTPEGWDLYRYLNQTRLRDRVATQMDDGEAEGYLTGIIEGATRGNR